MKPLRSLFWFCVGFSVPVIAALLWLHEVVGSLPH